MALRIQLRRDTAANWTSNDPTLAEGEAGFETDTGFLKIGDGTTAWTSLAYFTGPDVATGDGTTGGAASAGAGSQYVEITVAGTTYKVLHDGTVP